MVQTGEGKFKNLVELKKTVATRKINKISLMIKKTKRKNKILKHKKNYSNKNYKCKNNKKFYLSYNKKNVIRY